MQVLTSAASKLLPTTTSGENDVIQPSQLLIGSRLPPPRLESTVSTYVCMRNPIPTIRAVKIDADDDDAPVVKILESGGGAFHFLLSCTISRIMVVPHTR